MKSLLVCNKVCDLILDTSNCVKEKKIIEGNGHYLIYLTNANNEDCHFELKKIEVESKT